MPVDIAKVLDQIRGKGKIPATILIGGDNEYLVEAAFTATREAILSAQPSIQVERFDETSDLSMVLDSYRTASLFSRERLLVVPEVNAFVTKKELMPLCEKAIADWNSAKTDRKRASAVSKLLHLLGLLAFDADVTPSELGSALGLRKVDSALGEMLELIRTTGKKPTRGEGDAAMLADAIAHGGSPGAVLLMKTGEIPAGSATVDLIERNGAVVACNLTRDEFQSALESGIREIAETAEVRFDTGAVRTLTARLGIDRVLADKFSKEVPDLRLILLEAERLATFVGGGGRVTTEVVAQQIASVGGGARYEFASLFSEKKPVEAVMKLRDLVAQARREDPRTPVDVHYGKFLFPLADEIRQLIGIQSFAVIQKLDLRRPMQYNAFKDRLADALSAYLADNRLVRQRPHPFALHKKFIAAGAYRQRDLVDALIAIAEIDLQRKSGGTPIDVSLESLVLKAAR